MTFSLGLRENHLWKVETMTIPPINHGGFVWIFSRTDRFPEVSKPSFVRGSTGTMHRMSIYYLYTSPETYTSKTTKPKILKPWNIFVTFVESFWTMMCQVWSKDCGFLKSWGIPKSPWVSILSHGLVWDDVGVPPWTGTSIHFSFWLGDPKADPRSATSALSAMNAVSAKTATSTIRAMCGMNTFLSSDLLSASRDKR